MTRIGLIADVHGNRFALRAVIDVLRERGATSWICAGDLVGYGAAPDECVEVVCSLPGLTVVAGNHDLLALGHLDAARHSAGVRQSTAWTAERIAPSTRRVLEALPLRAATPEGLVVTHGSLGSVEEYVRDPAAALDQLEQLGSEAPTARGIVLGHTHLPMIHEAFGRRLVNPGAVGQSRDRDPRAHCALLDPGTLGVEPLRVAYDVDRARSAQRAAGLPPGFLHLRPPSVARRAWRRARRLRRSSSP